MNAELPGTLRQKELALFLQGLRGANGSVIRLRVPSMLRLYGCNHLTPQLPEGLKGPFGLREAEASGLLLGLRGDARLKHESWESKVRAPQSGRQAISNNPAKPQLFQMYHIQFRSRRASIFRSFRDTDPESNPP